MFSYKFTPEFLYADIEDVVTANYACARDRIEPKSSRLLDKTKGRDSLLGLLHEREDFENETLNDLLGSTSLRVGWSDEHGDFYE